MSARIPGWVEALLIGAVSRVVYIVAIYVAAARVDWLGLNRAPGGPAFLAWDATWYQWIAANGYHAAPVVKLPYGPGYFDFAFFPFWPAVIKALALDDSSRFPLVMPIAANLLFVLACVLIHRVLTRAFGRTLARWGLLFLAFGPSAYVYSMGYGEPLFLTLAGAFFLAGWKLRPVLGGMAMLTRLSGGLLAMAGVADLFFRGSRRKGIATIGGVVAAFALWWLTIAWITGDFFGYMLGTPSWYDVGTQPGRRPTGIDAFLKADDPTAALVLVLMLALLAGSLIVIRYAGSSRGPFHEADEADRARTIDLGRASLELRVLRAELGLFALGCFASSMLSTWSTMPRIASVGFPAFVGIAAALPGRRSRFVVFVVLALAGFYLTSLAMTREYTP